MPESGDPHAGTDQVSHLSSPFLSLSCSPPPFLSFFSFWLFVCFLFVWVFCLHMYLCMECPRRPEEGFGSLRSWVIDSYKGPCGCWESNLELLDKQSMILTTESSPPPLSYASFLLSSLSFPSLPSCFPVFPLSCDPFGGGGVLLPLGSSFLFTDGF